MDKEAANQKLLAWMRIVDRDGKRCWEWQRCRQKGGGYGMVVIEGKVWLTHRLSWTVSKGDIPEGMHVCHHCDNPPCFNPTHLFLGNIQTNAADRHMKGRDAKGEGNGNSKLSDEQVAEIRKKYKGQYGQLTQLAKEYGVCIDQIRNIVRGKQRAVGIEKINWITQRKRRIGHEYLGGKKSKSQE